jgi:hypothetical protein
MSDEVHRQFRLRRTTSALLEPGYALQVKCLVSQTSSSSPLSPRCSPHGDSFPPPQDLVAGEDSVDPLKQAAAFRVLREEAHHAGHFPDPEASSSDLFDLGMSTAMASAVAGLSSKWRATSAST